MTDLDESLNPVDGRVARRERNVNNVLDVVLDMFAEESLFPSIEQAANRSGLSLRSLYRYFADPGELLEAAIVRSREIGVEAAHLHNIGQGPLDQRIDDFVAMRLRLYDSSGPGFRATVANAARHSRINDELTRTRNDLREQFDLQFAAELAALEVDQHRAIRTACDALTQLDAIDVLRRHRELSAAEVAETLGAALRALLGMSRSKP